MKRNRTIIIWICTTLLIWHHLVPGVFAQDADTETIQPPKQEVPESEKKPKELIGILDLEANGVESTLVQTFSERLRVELFRTDRFRVLERGKMADILKEQNFQLTAYCSEECMQEVGNLLGVSKLVVGTINKTGNLYAVYLRMIDVKSGQFAKVATGECQCPIEEFIRDTSQEVAHQIAGLDYQSRYGTLRITSDPSGAQVFIDGQLKGETPLLLSKIKDGQYKLSLIKDKYKLVRKDITVEAQTLQNEEIRLERVTGYGSLYIQSEPTGASVSLNNQKKGQTPLFLKELPEGDYLLTLEKPDFFQVDKEIVVIPEQLRQEMINLKQKEAEIATGQLQIHTEPEGAKVILSGESLGITPIQRDKVVVGSYTLTLEKEGFEPESHVIQVEANRLNEQKYPLKPLPSNWWIWAVVGGAVVVVAGGTAAFFLLRKGEPKTQ